MTLELLLQVAGLAVLDMLSPTTIAVTVVVLLSARERPIRLLSAYWATVAVAYFALGVVAMLGLSAAVSVINTQVGLWIQLILGAALLVGSFFIKDPPPEKTESRLTPRNYSSAAMIALGVGTWTLEAATAVPYFAAIALMTAAGITILQWLPILAAYTVVMLTPCFLLAAAWVALGDRLKPTLEKWRAKLISGSRETVAWIIGIAGFLVARDAAARLFFGS